MRIAISTGGGDAPGLNAVIRAAVLSAINRGWEVLGIKRGFAGLHGRGRSHHRSRKDSVRGIAHLGGTILRTTNRGNPFSYPRKQPDGTFVEDDRSDELMENARQLGIDAIISIGGDGSLDIAQRLCDKGMQIVGVPKTIDNDVSGTVTTFGFDTAVNTALEAIDKLHTTAESHDRVMVMEVMGRDAGFIALHSGARRHRRRDPDPRDPVRHREGLREDHAARRGRPALLHRRRGRGRVPAAAATSHTIGESMPGQARRIGGVADAIAREIQQLTGKETRSLVLGHLQRGGMPTGYDRLLATRFGGAAVRAIADEKWGHMVALQSPHIVTIPIEEVLSEAKRVDPTHDVVQTARATGISFGD